MAIVNASHTVSISAAQLHCLLASTKLNEGICMWIAQSCYLLIKCQTLWPWLTFELGTCLPTQHSAAQPHLDSPSITPEPHIQW